jgi:hypothetical protein
MRKVDMAIVYFALAAIIPPLSIWVPPFAESLFATPMVLGGMLWLLAAISYSVSVKESGKKVWPIWLFAPLACGPGAFFVFLVVALRKHGV